MSTCEEYIEYLAAYADNELEGDLRERVRRHLEECPSCRRECEELKQVAALYRDAAVPQPTDARWAKVAGAVERCALTRAAPEEAPARARLHDWRWWRSGALAAAAVVLVVFFLPQPHVPVDDNDTVEGPAVQSAVVDEIESMDPDYEVGFTLPRDEDDMLVISVVRVEGDPLDS